MNAEQITLVQSSFEKVLPIADAAAEIFYARLFEIDPSLRSMFRSDMKQQGKKLMDALKVVVLGLKNLDRVVPMLGGLARRHVNYGVRNEHYATVGQALIDTLKKGLGADFTDEVCDAWLAAYTLISNAMMDAVAKADTAPFPTVAQTA
jgi:hemoglobin-like flavoprotein